MFRTVLIGSITSPTPRDKTNFTIKYRTHPIIGKNRRVAGVILVNDCQPGTIPENMYIKAAYVNILWISGYECPASICLTNSTASKIPNPNVSSNSLITLLLNSLLSDISFYSV